MERKTAYQLILAAEAKRDNTRNITRYYQHVVPLPDGECRIDTYAIKDGTKHTRYRLVVRKIAKVYSASNRGYVSGRVLKNWSFNNFVTNWCDYSFGMKHTNTYAHLDRFVHSWYRIEYTFNGAKMYPAGEYINDFTGTKYEHCGYDTNRIYDLTFKQYQECYEINHAVEFLSRAGLYRLIRPTFIRRMTNDKGLFRFFRDHYNEIRAVHENVVYTRFTPNAIIGAYRKQITLNESQTIEIVAQAFRRAGIKSDVDKLTWAKWVEKQIGATHIECDALRFAQSYSLYLESLDYLGIDRHAYGMEMPDRWTETFDEIYDRANAKRREEDRRIMRRQKAAERRARIERLEHWKIICGYLTEQLDGKQIGGYTVRIPTSAKELVSEGCRMRNCIGANYAPNYGKDGKDILVFFRDESGSSVMDAEINAQTMQVVQARYRDNVDATREDHELVEEIAKSIRNFMKNKTERKVA